MKKSISEVIEELVNPIIEEQNLELFDIEYVKEGKAKYLRIYIDKEDGVTIDDCQIVSQKLSKILDEKDPIVEAYFLEVSSPGIDRPLKKEKDFEKYKGREVDIKLYQALDSKKEYSGILLGLENDIVKIESEEKVLEFTRKDIAIIRLAVNF